MKIYYSILIYVATAIAHPEAGNQKSTPVSLKQGIDIFKKTVTCLGYVPRKRALTRNPAFEGIFYVPVEIRLNFSKS
jgi:hypothetical protein